MSVGVRDALVRRRFIENVSGARRLKAVASSTPQQTQELCFGAVPTHDDAEHVGLLEVQVNEMGLIRQGCSLSRISPVINTFFMEAPSRQERGADPTRDAAWMQRCQGLAMRAQSLASPNPKVGAVLIGVHGDILGEGWHARFGGPHAEVGAITNALERHGAEALRTATLYVNLAPCNHHGKTPPCVDLILKVGIPRVVVGMADPHAKAAGGVARLRAEGVLVTEGVLEHACLRLNEAFVHHLTTGRPLVTLKIAQTIDGYIATKDGEARWITGPEARRRGHEWRAEMDAILVGAGAARADDPALTVRLAEGPQPDRFVLDGRGLLPARLKLFTDAHKRKTTAIVGEGATPAYEAILQAHGGRILRVPEREGHIDLAALLDILGDSGGRDARPLQSIQIEAGPGLATALMRQDLVDRLFMFIAPKILGGGMPSLAGLGVHKLQDAVTFAEHHWEQVGSDLLFRGYRRQVTEHLQQQHGMAQEKP